MAVCTYDNPATMCRECWQDGELLHSYSLALMEQKGPKYFFFGANIGAWKKGQMVGDSAAIGSGSGSGVGTEPIF